jgi:hypothetical protein
VKPSDNNLLNSGDQGLDRLLRDFFRNELPSEMPPLPIDNARFVRVARPGKRFWKSFAVAAAAASVMVVAWLLRPLARTEQRVKAPTASSEETADRDVLISAGPGYRVVQRGLSQGARAADLEDPLQFRWKRLAVFEPRSGEQIELDMPEIVVTVNDLTITIDPPL